MKTFVRISLFIVLIAGVLFRFATPGLAQDATPPTPTETPVVSLESGIVPFTAFGETDTLMQGPFSSTDIRFAIPSSWALEAGAKLNLVISAEFSDLENIGVQSAGASLQVKVNGNIVDTLFINQEGEQVYSIPIPVSALVTNRLDGRHVISFSLNAALDCKYPHETIIIIHDTSTLELPHSFTAASADLTTLPRPYYQQDSFLPESTLLVIPDDPSATELQAAITVAAAFGRMSAGGLNLSLTRVAELSDVLKEENHLILVGTKEKFASVLPQSTFPPIKTETLTGDGILQTALSPWNQARVLLYVSGVDEVGVLKSAQALTFGTIQPGENMQTAVISNVNPGISDQTVADTRSFADLGYSSITVNGFGLTTLEYDFYMPPGYVSGSDPHLNLNYTYSALLDFGGSGAVVELNNQTVGSFQFTEETASQMNMENIPLYADILQPGNNRITIQIDMLPINDCSTFTDRGMWVTINSSSLINIPLIPAKPGQTASTANLNQFPYPFVSSPTLNDLVFVLSADDQNSWRYASNLAAEIGRRSTGQVLTPHVSFVDAIPDEFLQHNLIMVGIPVNIPILADLENAMPAPFVQGTNIVTERTLTVEYRLPTETSLGYLELFTSPWNVDRNILLVLGSTPEGLKWAFDAMTLPTLRGRVTGNFVVIKDTQIFSTDTRIRSTSIVPNASPANTPIAITPSATTPTSAPVNKIWWLLPAIITLSILTVAVVVVLVVRAIRNARIEK